MAMYPAIIKSYDAARRRVRIEMIGLTEGDKLLPEAELMYSVGDKSKNTEIEILAGDSVWVDFIADDPRYPVILGYRNPEVGNSVSWRKWHHANIEISADGKMVLTGKNLEIKFETIETTGKTTNNSKITNKSTVTNQDVVSMNAGMKNDNGGAVTCDGGMSIRNGDVVADSISLKRHRHEDLTSGGMTGRAES